MLKDFCAFILTHGRPDNVVTYKTLRKSGYTGKIYLVIDDEDKTADQYRAKYGDEVLQFSKSEVAKWTDEGNNFGDRRIVTYARNKCFDLAKQTGCEYFIELDDDYTGFEYRLDWTHKQITRMDAVLTAFLEYYKQTNVLSIAFSQAGDHMGGKGCIGGENNINARRKCMNSFICSVNRPFKFFGGINEDTNTYTKMGRDGNVFFTIMAIQLNQLKTQSNTGGLTDIYLDSGTYVKSFYTVMYCPSAAQIGVLKDPHAISGGGRIHHKLNWHKIAPKILREACKK